MGVPTLSRVVWSEGMHLAQHHFQAQSRYFESTMSFTLGSVFEGVYGFVSIELDEEALWNGSVSLVTATGVLPDGLAFELGVSDASPAVRRAEEFLSEGDESALVYLGIPTYRRGRANCDLSGNGGDVRTRFRAERIRLFDETTGTDEREVTVGRRNLELLAADEIDEDVTSLPLARIRVDSSGHTVYDPLFVPPLLSIAASPRITMMIQGLIEVLEAKSDALRSRMPPADSVSGVAAAELRVLWLTHAIYAAIGPLRHHLTHESSHPRQLFEDLARLAGAMCTFSMEADAIDLPLYEHDRPGDGFGALDKHIRRQLEVAIPETHLAIPLSRTEPNLHQAALDDPRMLSRGEWVLRVRSPAPTNLLISEGPKTIKVGSAEDVMKLIRDARPALDLEHIQSPPGTIVPRVGSQYFRVRREGRTWELVKVRKSIGVYVPDSIPDAELELLVVPE